MTTQPLHTADKLVYTAVLLYALAIFAGIILQSYLPYEQAKRVEWWTDTLASIPLMVLVYGAFLFPIVAAIVLLYSVWFGGAKS